MASTVSTPKAGRRQKRTRKTRVMDMTTDQLETMIEKVLDRKLSEWASDPRIARRRLEIAENAQATRAEYQSGKVKRGTVQDLLADIDA